MIINETITTIVIGAVIGLIFAYLRSIDEKISIIKATVHPDIVKTCDKLDEIKIILTELKTILNITNKFNPPK